MRKFKPGDKVVRNRSGGDMVECGKIFGRAGDVFVVVDYDDEYVLLYDTGGKWHQSFFDLVSDGSDLRVGDEVVALPGAPYAITIHGNGPGIVVRVDECGTMSVRWTSRDGSVAERDCDVEKRFFVRKSSQASEQKESKRGVVMELKDVKAANLKEAKKQYEEQRMNAEIAFAKQELSRAKDALDAIEREEKVLAERKKPYLDVIAKFS